MYFSRDVNFTTVVMFFFGIAAVGRCSISFLYLMEMLPSSRQVLVGTILHVFNASVGIIGCLYFWKISKNWLWLEMFAGYLDLVAMIGTIFLMPESPKYLLSKKRYDDAREAINYIAKFGRRKNIPYFYCQFDREIIDRYSVIRVNESDTVHRDTDKSELLI
jgi:hypothetical protein